MTVLLVTGGTGMVGQAIRRNLPDGVEAAFIGSGHDLRNQAETEAVFKVLKPSKVIHLAAKVGGVKANSEQVADFFNENILINTNVLMAAHKNNVQDVVSLLSTCVYPDKDWVKYPLTEEQLHNGPPHDSNFGYAYAKRMVEVQSRAFRQQYGRNYTTAIPNNIYGPCFSDDTEVLTPKGLVNIKSLSVGDSLYTLNPKTFEVEIAKVSATTQTWSKETYSFTSKAVDFLVTPEHKMFYKTSSGFVKKPASFFKERCGKKYGQITFAHHLPMKTGESNMTFSMENWVDSHHVRKNQKVRDHRHSKSKGFPLEYDLGDLSELIGWYISEGSINTYFTKGGRQSKGGLETGQISIAQNRKKNPKRHKQIRELLTRMGIPHGWDDRRVYFTSRLFRNFFKAETGIGSKNKRVPQMFFSTDFAHSARERLFTSMMLGDGHKSGRKYTTASETLQEQFLHLCFLLGKKVSGVSFDGCYRIHLRNDKVNPTVKYKNITNTTRKIAQKYFCITASKNHIIFAGRNKKLNWIGQCDNFDLENGHVLPAIVRKIYEAKHQQKTPVFWGNGLALREFTLSDDVAICLLKMAGVLGNETYVEATPCNIGTSEEVTIKTAVKMVAEIFEYDGPIEWDESKPSGQLRKPSLSKRIKHEYTPLREGLKLTCDWFAENYPNVRGVK